MFHFALKCSHLQNLSFWRSCKYVFTFGFITRRSGVQISLSLQSLIRKSRTFLHYLLGFRKTQRIFRRKEISQLTQGLLVKSMLRTIVFHEISSRKACVKLWVIILKACCNTLFSGNWVKLEIEDSNQTLAYRPPGSQPENSLVFFYTFRIKKNY